MSLELQIISLIFSFIFGFSFSFVLNINDKIIYSKIKVVKFIGSFLIVLISILIYFYFLQIINNSNFHPYQLIMIILGYLFYNVLYRIVKSGKR